MSLVEEKDIGALSSFFRGKIGHRRAAFLMKILTIDRLNRVYDKSSHHTGTDFSGRFLSDIGIKYIVGNADRLNQLPEGAFITVSNHPYGGIDGLMLIDLIARMRPDFRVMVNKTLLMVKTLRDNFISVTSLDNEHESLDRASLRGIRDTVSHLRNGHPVGFFPSGAISDFSMKDMCIRDRPWQPGILHLIHSARVPVLPVRFFDRNSLFFYILGLINWRVRLLRLPYEVFNKRGQEPRIGIGNIITVEEQERLGSPRALGEFLRKSVYEMPAPVCTY
ncbi:MAG: 1-acyl-sn-glycerol-3-phosphate acyltransferase [Bacteroidales bacterium]|jgi:putative hemolysin|nr:1-acyl-sn-glycerol-3-phosphate acyltransferase [Bacteroidales bacterium]